MRICCERLGRGREVDREGGEGRWFECGWKGLGFNVFERFALDWIGSGTGLESLWVFWVRRGEGEGKREERENGTRR